MRPALLSAAALLLIAFVPAPAQANPCQIDDAPCLAECLLFGDPCGIYNPHPGIVPCPAGETGAGLDTSSHTVYACVTVPTVTAASCPGTELGIVLIVNGQPTAVCLPFT